MVVQWSHGRPEDTGTAAESRNEDQSDPGIPPQAVDEQEIGRRDSSAGENRVRSSGGSQGLLALGDSSVIILLWPALPAIYCNLELRRINLLVLFVVGVCRGF
ncbi:unnamed protein product [Bursaphelenchus xylophilus]|uniref:(pine wood nematode) hypothetical protein n=1 Tax=Bursaphelenchus xylophilus TaxID=6326 RepID=A0A1I7RQJ1_BURXY|nr:unnamed protein product [Bursaphelenchus xylophilus]CAG9104670.1 unnamed protein product [Bursaphelenchus xylophilus]